MGICVRAEVCECACMISPFCMQMCRICVMSKRDLQSNNVSLFILRVRYRPKAPNGNRMHGESHKKICV